MYVEQIDRMEQGSEMFEIISHNGEKCDCGYTKATVPVKTRSGYANYNWKVVRTHKSKKVS